MRRDDMLDSGAFGGSSFAEERRRSLPSWPGSGGEGARMIGVGVLGYGYWGPNLVRNFSEAEGARVISVGDPRE